MDSKGVMGLPMRLALAFTIIALCTPALVGLAEDFSEKTETDDMEKEISGIGDAAKKAYLGGKGTVAKTDVELVPGYEIVLGGPGPDCHTIRLLRNGTEVSKSILEYPSVRFLEVTNISGNCTLILECQASGTYGLKVTAE